MKPILTIDKLINFSAFTLTLALMLPLIVYTSPNIKTLPIFFGILLSLTSISTIIHTGSYNYFTRRKDLNEFHQHNIVFIGTVVFLEMRNIEYEITKTETTTSFAFHIKWALADSETEQLRAIFCSLCIHNFKGITPTKTTKMHIQNDWEVNLSTDLTIPERKKLWKKQTQSLQNDFKKNKDLISNLHQLINTNVSCEDIYTLLKNE